MIRLETSQGTGIDNDQTGELTHQVLALHKQLKIDHPNANPRCEASVEYNCHGLTFASRRTWVFRSVDITTILTEDEYTEIEDMYDVLPGDIVIYFSANGDPNHSGIVVGSGPPLIVPHVCSKWANCGEFLHSLHDCPPMYGPIKRFFRCTR